MTPPLPKRSSTERSGTCERPAGCTPKRTCCANGPHSIRWSSCFWHCRDRATMPRAHSLLAEPESPRTRPSERTRVMFCVDNMLVGGTELNAVRTAERLDRARFDLTVICLQETGPLMARYEAAGIPVLPFPIKRLYGSNAVRQGL